MTVRKPIVGIDCDGVLSDFNKSALAFIERETGKVYHHTEITQWDILINFGLQHLEPKLDHEIEHNKFCLNMEPYEEAFPAMFDLEVFSEEVHCVTAPYHIWTWPGQRIQWLQQHFSLKKSNIALLAAKHHFELDVFVDDSLKNCLKYASHRPNTRVFLWDKTYNQSSAVLPKNVIRTSDWQEIVDCVRNFEGSTP